MPGASFGSIGSGPGAGLRFASRRGRSLDGTQVGMRYPSPFFDIAQTYLPTSIKNMLRWCKYYYLVHPIFNAVISKMSEYPVTELSYDTEHEELQKRWKHVLEDSLDIQATLIAAGLDYYTYGNCFLSLIFPFKKYLKCQNCKNITPISKAEYKFRDYNYLMVCTKCSNAGPALIVDRYMRSLKGVKLVRWGPENIGIIKNQVTGESLYTYDMPVTMKNDILIGKKEIIERIPHVFVEALRLNKAIQFNSDNVFHLKRAHLAEQDEGWGMPLPFASLKSAFYLQILQKAQEAIAQEHIVPLRILFPQASAQTGDPYGSADLRNWAKQIEKEVARWRFDNNHIPIMPLPVGHQTIGGDGRALLLHQEIRIWSEQIVAGMGVPQEFIFGGLSWSGSNVSLRMLENTFLVYRQQLLKLVRWVVHRVSMFMNWPAVPVHFTDFKMADDIQRKQMLVNLSSMNKVSDRTLLDEMGLDYVNERKQLEAQFKYDKEYQKQMLISQAEAQGEAQVVASRYQKKIVESSGAVQPGVLGQEGQEGQQQGQPQDARSVARAYAKELLGMPPQEQQKMLGQLNKKFPYLTGLIMEYMEQLQQQGGAGQPMGGGQPGVSAPRVPQAQQVAAPMMKPLPEQRPPRRSAAAGVI